MITTRQVGKGSVYFRYDSYLTTSLAVAMKKVMKSGRECIYSDDILRSLAGVSAAAFHLRGLKNVRIADDVDDDYRVASQGTRASVLSEVRGFLTLLSCDDRNARKNGSRIVWSPAVQHILADALLAEKDIVSIDGCMSLLLADSGSRSSVTFIALTVDHDELRRVVTVSVG